MSFNEKGFRAETLFIVILLFAGFYGRLIA